MIALAQGADVRRSEVETDERYLEMLPQTERQLAPLQVSWPES